MPKTQKQMMDELQHDRKTENRTAERRESLTQKTSAQRVAAALPNMPGPKPGGLAESMANPQALQESLARTRQRREDYEDAKVKAGVKDTRLPANTPGNRVSFAEGATAKPGAKMHVDGNPRFAPRAPEAPPAPPEPTPVPLAKTVKTKPVNEAPKK